MATTQPMGAVNPKTGMTHAELREFVGHQFEEFVKPNNLNMGNMNFPPEFVDRGSDVPPGMPPGPEGAIAYVGGALKKFPDMHVEILDMVAEDDKVVVQNRCAGAAAASGKKYE